MILLDTEVYVRLGLNFDNPKLLKLVELISAGEVELLITEVIRREVETDLIENSNELWEKCQGLARDIERKGLGRSLPKLPTTLRKITKASLQEAQLGGFRDFQTRAKVKQIPTPSNLLPKILDDYFASTPPFGTGKKQKEFPDAVSVYATAAFAEEKHQVVTVVSDDPDIKNACGRFPRLQSVAAIENFMAEIVDAQTLLRSTVEGVSSFLAEPPDALLLDIREAFESLNFQWVGEDRGDIIEVDDAKVTKLYDGTVLSVNAGQVFATVDADIKFTVEVSLERQFVWTEDYPRQRGSKRDSILNRDVAVSVDLQVNVDPEGSVKNWRIVQLNDGNDIQVS